MSILDQSSYPVVTLNDKKLVEGYFSYDNLSSKAAKLMPSEDEVRGNLRERYRIPKNDPVIDPSWSMRKISSLETMSYLTAIRDQRESRKSLGLDNFCRVSESLGLEKP